MSKKVEELYLKFTSIKCECGHEICWNDEVCKYCGKTYEKRALDREVKNRIEKYKEIFKIIKVKDEEVKNIKNKNKSYKDNVLDYIDYLQSIINEINIMAQCNVFNINNSEENEIRSIKEILLKSYEIYIKMKCIEPFKDNAWINVYNRIIKAIEEYISSYKLMASVKVSKNLSEANKKLLLAQEHNDRATDEMYICSGIIHILHVNLGNNDSKEVVLNTMNRISRLESNEMAIAKQKTYDYFKQQLDKPLEYYDNKNEDVIYELMQYRETIMTTFNEITFFRKLNLVRTILENSNKKDKSIIIKILNTSKNNLTDILKNFYNLSKEAGYLCKYDIYDEEFAMEKGINWYKTLYEGVYKKIMPIVTLAYTHQKNKCIDDEIINNRIEYSIPADITDFFDKNTKKLSTKILNDGVDSRIRNAEAHVEYVINDEERIIKLIDKLTRDKKTEIAIYSYNEFVDLFERLRETVVATLYAIVIFIVNKYEDYEDIFKHLIKEGTRIIKPYREDLVFYKMSLTDVKRYRNGGILTIACKSTKSHKCFFQDDKLFAKYISGLWVLSKINSNMSQVVISIYDKNDTELKISTSTDCTKSSSEYNETHDWILFELNVIMECNDYKKELDAKMKRMKCDYFHALINEVVDIGEKVSSNVLIQNNEMLRSENYQYSDILNGLKYIIDTLKNCTVKDRRFIICLIDIYRELEQVVATKSISKFQQVRSKVAQLCGILSSFDDQFDKKLNEQIRTLKIERNELCPCGSGKKYKKCCYIK